MRNLWDRLETADKLSIGCILLYLSLYVVVDISEAIATWIFF